MKNKIVYSFILIFSISLLSSAGITNGTCDKSNVCRKAEKKCNELKKADQEEITLPSLGLFLFNI